MAGDLHLAPIGILTAGLDAPDHAGFQDRDGLGLIVRIVPQRGVAGLDDEIAPSGQGGLIDPSLDAVGVADGAPVFELALDLHGQFGALVDPVDSVAVTPMP